MSHEWLRGAELVAGLYIPGSPLGGVGVEKPQDDVVDRNLCNLSINFCCFGRVGLAETVALLAPVGDG